MSVFYLAPLEGITGYILRNAILDIFPEGVEKVYAPFIMPHIKIPMSKKDMEDISPSHNSHGRLIPQILTNDAAGFLTLAGAMRDLGYKEINLNLGCPSKTVASKGRGAGFLAYPKALDDFLDRIFKEDCGPISIKTRIGSDDPEEFYKLLEIYNKYPIYELTIHPRVKTQGYSGTPYTELYYYALKHSTNPVCYNGDILNDMDIARLITQCPKGAAPKDYSHTVMIGRGMIRNPGLIRELTTDKKVTSDELMTFLKRLRTDYSSVFSGDTPVLFKMKEIWSYMRMLFPEADKDIKKMLKCKALSEYGMYEERILKTFNPHPVKECPPTYPAERCPKP